MSNLVNPVKTLTLNPTSSMNLSLYKVDLNLVGNNAPLMTLIQ